MRPIVPLLLGAAVVTAGLVIGGTWQKEAGGAVTLVGWLVMLVGLHRYGRSGGGRSDLAP